MYPMNWPLASFLGRFGVPLLIKVIVKYDKESQTYYATSPNLKGLLVEAESLDELKREVEDCAIMLFEHDHVSGASRKNTHISLSTRYVVPA